MNDDDIQSLIETIYDAALDPDVWPSVLTRMAEVVGGIGGVIVPVRDRTMTVIASRELAESNAAYERYWWQHDIRVGEFRRRALAPGMFTDSDFLSKGEMARSPFYQDFLRPEGFGHFLAQVSRVAPGHTSAFSFLRDVRKGGFEDEHRSVLKVIGRHAARSLALTTRVRHTVRIGQAMAAAMEQITCGIVLLDAGGSVAFLNPAARQLMGKAFNVRHGRLVSALPQDQARLDLLVAGALPGTDARFARSVALTRNDNAPPALLQAIPISAASADRFDRFLLGDGGVLILMHDVGAVASHSIQGHLLELGLTPGQARVAELVGNGKSPRDAAMLLGIQESTVRTVLKQVFARLELSRQSELAALVARLAFLA